jgi:hypothetical protein
MARSIVLALVLIGATAACSAGSSSEAQGDQNALSAGGGAESDASTDSGGEPTQATDASANVGDAGAEGGYVPPEATVRVRSFLPPAEAATLQAIFDRFGIRPAACNSQATIGPPSAEFSAWQLNGMGIEPASGSLTDDEATALHAIFDRLEVSPSTSVTFVRNDHTECMPQDGVNQWEVSYEQSP